MNTKYHAIRRDTKAFPISNGYIEKFNSKKLNVDIASALVPNATRIDDINNDLKGIETRRKRKKKDRSTSSSENDKVKDSSDSDADKESLQLSTHELTSSSSESKDGLHKPKSSIERRGWRKWHRKCVSCPDDMAKKWRDPSIKWICGAYQRARRSFKSPCMMHYRNCQDGTMFVKIHDHRCANDTDRDQRRGMHFFYDYPVNLEDDSSSSSQSSESLTDTSFEV
ncbi:unnamed protein product [Euphydryas editha]|uniref:Uncharacterized protein n=1 Tax=Euphydryas editha TaxID=104508 RepID=A0AAU9UFG7_EUPED|nr:unnamed protein product [Euphydryas editha]